MEEGNLRGSVCGNEEGQFEGSVCENGGRQFEKIGLRGRIGIKCGPFKLIDSRFS